MSDGTEDLSAKARRGELHDADRRRLQLALQSSLEARLLHRASCEFHAGDTVLPGDDELADRIVRRMLAGRGARRRSRARVWLLAAAVACLTAGAAAAVGQMTGVFAGNDRESESRAVKVKMDPPGQPAPHTRPAPSERAIQPAASEAAERQEPSSERPKLPGEPPKPRSRSGMQTDDASSLFARANLARREQRIDEAIALYQLVEHRFPRSAEARASQIALGTLQLNSDASASLRHYRRYLAENPNGALSPEALWGEAQSLSALGRTNEARQAWRFLIERFPESVYAKSARNNLERTR
jgi:TolA-binding protein